MKQLLHNHRFFLIYYLVLAAWLATTAMHIPDGYLSPVSDLVMLLLVTPFWVRGVQRLRQTANTRNIPVIALFAALCFVIMMFNLPLPGGTTGHAVGGALAAIVLGPEVATIAVTIALVIQALFFGDGGILAIGANSFNMAVVLPYVSYSLYQAITRRSKTNPKWLAAASGLSAWTGLTVAALFAGIEFGLQPLLFHGPDGTPTFAPYPLSVAIPAMVIPHALAASIVEGGFTALVVAYLLRSNKIVLHNAASPGDSIPSAGWRRVRGYILALVILAIATPLGLLAPGTAWGEWTARQLTGRGLGFIPIGLAAMSSLWNAPMAGYNLPALHNASLGYILSAGLGVFLVLFLVWLFSALFTLNRPRTKAEKDQA